ncbi:hypothetical protein ABW19_dt0203820 [Dactylella cylindrospora]|nr:hypothetical protein ABW19_dt0203820 [Dactylella cylindrospora]
MSATKNYPDKNFLDEEGMLMRLPSSGRTTRAKEITQKPSRGARSRPKVENSNSEEQPNDENTSCDAEDPIPNKDSDDPDLDDQATRKKQPAGYDFCSLGNIVFDRVVVGSDIIICLGGRGLYGYQIHVFSSQVLAATIGARMVLQGHLADGCIWPLKPLVSEPAPLSEIEQGFANVGIKPHWLEARSDFPVIDSWYDPDRKVKRIIELDTVTNIVKPSDLDEECLKSKVFHICCGPTKAVHQIRELQRLILKTGKSEPPIIVWQPEGRRCIPQVREEFLKASSMADVVIPNYIDLIRVFRYYIPEEHATNGRYVRKIVEKACQATLNVFQKGTRNGGLKGMIVAQCNQFGVFVYGHPKSFKGKQPSQYYREKGAIAMKRRAQWLPRLFNVENESDGYIRDTSGTEESFIGGFCAFIAKVREEYIEAAIFGHVAASLTSQGIEPPGLKLSDSGEELWHGETFISRLDYYYSMCLGRTRVPRLRAHPGEPFSSISEYIPDEWYIPRGPDKLFRFPDPRTPTPRREDDDTDSETGGIFTSTLVKMHQLAINKAEKGKGKMKETDEDEENDGNDDDDDNDVGMDARIKKILNKKDEHEPLVGEHSIPRFKYPLLDLEKVGQDYNWNAKH